MRKVWILELKKDGVEYILVCDWNIDQIHAQSRKTFREILTDKLPDKLSHADGVRYLRKKEPTDGGFNLWELPLVPDEGRQSANRDYKVISEALKLHIAKVPERYRANVVCVANKVVNGVPPSKDMLDFLDKNYNWWVAGISPGSQTALSAVGAN